MKNPWLHFLLAAVPTAALVVFLNFSWGVIPPLGRLLDPFQGFWQNAETAAPKLPDNLQLPGLQAQATVQLDDRLVPHIYATNAHDAYYLQGYLTAWLRLWQSDFQTRFAAGTLSEVLGARTLPLDLNARRLGIGKAAEAAWAEVQKDSMSRQMVEAYSAGMNAYIATLSPKDYPLEYKILDYAPSTWTPLHCALLLKSMALTLTNGGKDWMLTALAQQYGQAAVDDLFPLYPHAEEPIIPKGTKWDFAPLKVPAAPEPKLFANPEPNLANAYETYHEPYRLGSNDWAVGAACSATGHPILADDPHLTLSLPSIWLEMHLVAPGLNVYGATLPGAPGVIIGFNERVAWGVTNVGADVQDWYQIEWRDDDHGAYRYDKGWRPTTKRVEVIGVRGGPAVIDTVVYTHHGPVPYLRRSAEDKRKHSNVGLAMRWVAHDPSNEVLTFYLLNRAKGYDDYVRALSHFACPAQNFVYADVQNNIALWSNGRYPLKWPGQGRLVGNGGDSQYDWQGWVPHAHNPHVLNPPQGYVSSANQHPADKSYPYYLGDDFAGYSRGRRINQRLAAMKNALPDSLRALHSDNMNLYAHDLLPTLLGHINKEGLGATHQQALDILSKWNYHNDAEQIAPTLYDSLLFRLGKGIFEDELWRHGLPSPKQDRLVHMILHDSTSRWYDDVRTPGKETLTQLINSSFKQAVDSLQHFRGPIGPEWQYGVRKATYVQHLARIPGMSRENLMMGGGASSVNATSRNHGPSWRMVVAVGDEPEAYGIYPGGQSGNPGSKFYDNMVDAWRTGQLARLLYLRQPNPTHKRITQTVVLGGK